MIGRGLVRPPNRFSVRPPAVAGQAANSISSQSMGQPAQVGVDAEKAPVKVFMDAQGRITDASGNIINMRQTKELKINEKNQKDGRTKDLERIMKFGKSQSNAQLSQKRKFYDSGIDAQGPAASGRRDKRKNAALNFVAEGTYIKRGEIMRRKQILQENDPLASFGEQLGGQSKDASKDKKNEFGEPYITLKPPMTFNVKVEKVPEHEWWDEFFVPPHEEKSDTEEKYPVRFESSLEDKDFYVDRVTHYIQHPVPLRNEEVEKNKAITIPFFLTEAEKKKLRRKKRLEKERDRQEKVSLGLMPAPQARVTMSNYLRVMTKEAIADPSKCERDVKKIVAQRIQDHLNRNEANKLTRDQKEQKMKRKHDRDLAKECRVAIFKISKVPLQAQLKFKVDMNAQQLHLGGVCLIADHHIAPDLPHLVMVEGGPTAIKRYKKLMLRRIPWTGATQAQAEGTLGENEEAVKESTCGQCVLVWEGIAKKKAFEKWRVVEVRTEHEARRILSEKGQEHVWSMVSNYQAARAVGEEPEDVQKLLA